MVHALEPRSPSRVRVSGRSWLRDFEFGPTGLVVRKTGARVPYSPSVIADVIAWFRFFFAALSDKPEPGPRFTVAFSPDRARPWYLIWPVVRLAGGKAVNNPARADLVFHFDDATYAPNAAPEMKPGALAWNFGCHDVSKSHVGAVFEAVFGYNLTVDPATHAGEMVEKSEINAVHDGRILQGPMPARPGKNYQRLIDNRIDDGARVEDLRTSVVCGRLINAYRKRRPIGQRFANTNTEVILVRPEEVFSEAEISLILQVAARLGMQWGGLDVLRDAQDGRLYIVDANKTDMGPAIALPLRDKRTAARNLAKAVRAAVFAPRPAVTTAEPPA